ncbi:MAG: hypothetical protein HKO57_17655 [Akkermansiaceae bacterium]|nr:hypothetical protein [Akkermansiaceae bacterium]
MHALLLAGCLTAGASLPALADALGAGSAFPGIRGDHLRWFRGEAPALLHPGPRRHTLVVFTSVWDEQ